MKSVYFFSIALALACMVPQKSFSQCISQINLQNPSFEGNSGTNSPPPSWSACDAWSVGPATQPGVSNPGGSGENITITSQIPSAYEGNTFLGLGYEGGPGGSGGPGAQGVGQELAPGDTFYAGVTYTTSIELAVPTIYTEDDKNKQDWTYTCGGICIYGGNDGNPCATTEQLWCSGPITNTSWQTFQISFTPSMNITSLVIVSTTPGCYDEYPNYYVVDYTYVDTIAPILSNFQLNATVLRNNACSYDSLGQATVSVASGPGATSYQWSTNPAQTSSTLANVPAGTYTVTVHSGSTYCATASVTVSAPPVLTANANADMSTCFSNHNGTINANASGGTPNYNYSWNNGAYTGSPLTDLGPGVYSVVVSDEYNCTATSSVTIDSTPPMNVDAYVKPADCPNYTNGYATANPVGGNTPYKAYTWGGTNQSGQTAYNLSQGDYSVTVTDDENCTASATISVTGSAPSDNLTATNANSCNGHTINGSITGSPTGGTPPYQYQWEPSGQSVPDPVNLSPGTYNVTVTDDLGCTATATATVDLTSGVSVAPTSNGSGCGASTGFAAANPSGGAGNNYVYHWSNGASTDTITNIASGPYRVTVSENGCSATASINVQQTQSPDSVVFNNQTVNMCSGDSAYICVNNTNSFTSYHWNNGSTSPCAYTYYAGQVYLTVTDNNGCITESSHLTVNVYPNPPVSISAYGNTLTVHDATNIQWILNGTPISGATDSVYVATIGGDYTVEITDSNGCHETSQPLAWTGITNLNTDLWVNVFPNPSTNGAWQLMVGDAVIGGTIRIFDDNGRLVYKAEIEGPNSTLALDVAKGIYFMQIITPYKNFNVKLTRL